MKYTVYNFINGAKIIPTGTRRIDIENPQTGEVIANMACSSQVDLDNAVAYAERSSKIMGCKYLQNKSASVF